MVMIIASIYIFLSYVIFDQQLKITEKNPLLLFAHSPPNNSKSTSPNLFSNIENFFSHPSPPVESARAEGG